MGKWAQFAGHAYLNLETFRKTGAGVKTPVWFVEEGDCLYVRTRADSAKVKRLRRSGQVRVAPCTANGDLKGEWEAAEARLEPSPAVAAQINGLMNRKYGLMKRLFDLRGAFVKAPMATIVICRPG